MAPYGEGEQDDLLLMLLDEVSVASSMVATFAPHDDRTVFPFEVLALHKAG